MQSIMELHNFTNYKYLKVTDLGFKKGMTPVMDENVQEVYNTAEIIY